VKFYVSCGHQDVDWALGVARQLRAIGYEVVSTWHDDEIGYKPDMTDLCVRDVAQIEESDALLTNGVTTSGGAHSELGYALALGKRCFLMGERRSLFHWHAYVDIVSDILCVGPS